MSRVFTLELLEADGVMVGYVLDDGNIRCLACGTIAFGKDAFDWHLDTNAGDGLHREPNANEGGEAAGKGS